MQNIQFGLAAVSNRFNGVTLPAFSYANDALGRRVSRADSGPALAQPQSNAFAYNARSEITGALLHTNAYGYVFDSIGNRLAATANGAETTYTANTLNQYTAVNTATPQYDADGNMTAFGVWAYTYDAENRMTGVASNGIPVASYTYDYGSRLVREETATMTRRFIWDGGNIAASIEIDKAEQSTNTTHYVWGLDLSGTLQGAGGVGGLLAAIRDNGTFFPCYDANGNVTEYVDESGTIRAHYEYSPFGEIIAQSGDLADTFRFRFSTKYHDPETGHYYYGYRFYDPPLGRWLNRDPLEEEGGINLYNFLMNGGLNTVDVLGSMSKEAWELFFKNHIPPTPSIGDHLPWANEGGGSLGENAWWERQYPGWLKYSRELFTRTINTWVGEHCGETRFAEDTNRQAIFPYYLGSSLIWPSRDPGENETRHGDTPQNPYYANRVIGKFSIDLRTPVNIRYSGKSGDRRTFSWQATMYVDDVLGLQQHDGLTYRLLGWVLPSRRVVRAEWKISGEGECCER